MAMKTLAELKRDANSGRMSAVLIEHYGHTGDDIPERLRGRRKAVRTNSIALFFQNCDGKESELRFRSANLVEYDGNTLTVYEAGIRDLTEEEKAVLAEWKRIEDEYTAKNPWSDTYWKRKDYFANCSCPWLAGHDTIRGKRYQYDGKVRDNAVKGTVILKYDVYMEE